MRLELDGVVAGYGGPPILRGVDVDVPGGELLSVLGASGSGKTTLLRVVAGLHRPDAGRVLLGGRDLAAVAPGRRGVGLVPQEGALFGHLDVAGNVAYGVRDRAARDDRVAEMLALVDLPGMARRMPHELSGGQRQRVALARALAPRPRVVLLDEPFASLDAALRAEVRTQVVDVLRAAGATAVLITHDRHEAMSVSDRVAVLRDGAIAQVGEPRELYARPATEWLATFLGDATLVPGHRDGAHAVTPLGTLPTLDPGPPGPVTAVVRPEQVRLAPGRDATVRTVEFTGAAQHVRVDGPDGLDVAARVPAEPRLRRGDTVTPLVDGPVHVLPREERHGHRRELSRPAAAPDR